MNHYASGHPYNPGDLFHQIDEQEGENCDVVSFSTDIYTLFIITRNIPPLKKVKEKNLFHNHNRTGRSLDNLLAYTSHKNAFLLRHRLPRIIRSACSFFAISRTSIDGSPIVISSHHQV